MSKSTTPPPKGYVRISLPNPIDLLIVVSVGLLGGLGTFAVLKESGAHPLLAMLGFAVVSVTYGLLIARPLLRILGAWFDGRPAGQPRPRRGRR
jgi:hypothetical protein